MEEILEPITINAYEKDEPITLSGYLEETYGDNLEYQKDQKILSEISSMGVTNQLKAVQFKDAFSNKGLYGGEPMEGNWRQLFTTWLFERDGESSSCMMENSLIAYGFEELGAGKVSPDSFGCSTKNIGYWRRGKGGIPELVVTDEKFMNDIKKRPEYQMARQQIQTDIHNGKTYVGKEYNAGSHFDGPTTATHQYNEVEWFLGSYATKIRVDAINPETGATTVSVVTTNKSHWESATRYQGALKNRKDWDGGEYLYSNHSRNNYPRYEYDLEKPLYESSIYPDRYENTSLREESFNHELVNPNPQYQGRDVIVPTGFLETHNIPVTPIKYGFQVGDVVHSSLGGDIWMRFESTDVIEK